MKVRYFGQDVGGWLFDVRPVFWVRVRFRIEESEVVGPGPSIHVNIPWYHGNKILQMCLRVDVLFFHWLVEWNLIAV